MNKEIDRIASYRIRSKLYWIRSNKIKLTMVFVMIQNFVFKLVCVLLLLALLLYITDDDEDEIRRIEIIMEIIFSLKATGC